MEAFETFWSLYPRKMSRKDALKAWLSTSESNRELAVKVLPVHIKYWQAEGREKTFIPYPATWLRAESFHDEIEMPEPKATHAWWTSDDGVMKKAREIDIAPKPGEDMSTFRQRVITYSKRAA